MQETVQGQDSKLFRGVVARGSGLPVGNPRGNDDVA